MSPAAARSVRRVLARHLVSMLVVVLGVTVCAVVLADRIAAGAAADHAELDTRTLATKYVVPLSVNDLTGDDPATREALDTAFAARLEHDELRRIKIWEPAGGSAGTIIYSDLPALVGRTLDLGDSARLFGTDDALANSVEPGDYAGDPYPEGTFEAYVGFVDRTGSPYVFEAYFPAPQTAVTRGDLLRDWLPLVIGALLGLGFATVPLSLRLARRAAESEAERRALLTRALDAGAAERRRIARRLHDGVVQDLSGAGMALDSVDGLGESQRSVIGLVAEIIRRDVQQLRSLSEELFPATTDDLAAPVRAAIDDVGLPSVTVEVGPCDGLGSTTSTVVHDVVREALRNVDRHAAATSVEVTARADASTVTVVIADDGVGLASPPEPGHLGLRLAEHAARELGGSLTAANRPDGGTVVTLVLPRA